MNYSTRVVPLLVALCLTAPVAAQKPQTSGNGSNGLDLATAKPGRDPKQPIDEAYTKKIKEYTTETFFNSPLTDYLPASKTVPTPAVVLGDIAGAPGKLPYSKEVYDYMRRLEKATPRVKVYSIGQTEEGREMIAVAVASEALMKNLDANKADLAKLADPRTIKFDDELADRIARRAAPIYYITGTIHSTEAGAPTALMELAYRLAVDDSPYIRNIREHVVTLITPIVEVDGRDRVVDAYEWKKKHPNETPMAPVYWGHYVMHDNNRDAMALTLKLSQNVLNTYLDWKALVLHDLHESVALLYDNTIGNGPYNAWLDPILTNEWQLIGWNNVNEMTRMGMPGVFAWGTFDTWSPGYLMFMAAMHNGISRLYETFGNGGSADTEDRTLSPADTARTWYRQNPAPSRVRWSLRNNNNYEQTGLLVSLNYVANNRVYFLRNFYDKSKRSIAKAKVEGPAAYVFPANDPRPGAQAELLRVLQKQAVEISRATQAFTVTVPTRPAAGTGRGGGRGGRGGNGAGDQNASAPPPAPQPTTKAFPAGSYIVRMDQPYSRIADTLLDYQYWSPNDEQERPYDDTGWTFPEAFAVQAVRVTDTKVLDVPMETVTGTVTAPSGVTGTGSVFAINHNADTGLISLRYRLKDADIQIAEEPFDARGMTFNRGSFIISKVSRADLEQAVSALGLRAVALDGGAPSVKTHPARAARIAVLHMWTSTQTEGWWRQAFDTYGVPYDYVDPKFIRDTANLRDKYDVIIFGPGGSQSAVLGAPLWRNPIPYQNTADTPNVGTWAQTEDTRIGMGLEGLVHLQQFIDQGGAFIASNSSADFAINNNFTYGVTANRAGSNSRVVGSLLRTKLADAASPIVYGIPDNLAVYSDAGETFRVSATVGGFGRGGGGGGGAAGGGREGNAPTRPTGRGTPDDPDVVQGRPADEPTSMPEAPKPPTVQPWQYALPTEEALKRNPANVIPPQFRPRVPLRYDAQNALLVSGLLSGGADIAQRPVVVDVPVGKGHVVLFAANPIYRGETVGSYFMVFNTILNFDSLDTGRTLDPR
jgi:hypothetical protein